jgi:TMEM175 potassium channel family protein
MGANLDRFRAKGVDRAGAFSDGVYAIALTLLVLNFKFPHLHGSTETIDRELWRYIRNESGTFLSYAVSVFVIGRYWLAHHRMFRLFRHTDAVLLELNLVALALVAFLPYPTELLGSYGDTRTATVFYAASVAAVGAFHGALCWHGMRAGLIESEVTDAYRRHALARGVAMPAIFLASIPVAFLSVTVAQVMWWTTLLLRPLFRSRYGSIYDPYGESTPAAG